MLLICLRDDIPLSLNAKQLDEINFYIQFKLDFEGSVYFPEKNIKTIYNNIDKHKIHNVFFVESPESELKRISFIPDVVCNLYEPIIEQQFGPIVYRNDIAHANLHDMIFEGQIISFYVDSKIEYNDRFAKIEYNDRFEFLDMMQRLLPFIKSHLAGNDISDLYWRQNLMITQIRK